ncbi:serine protease inhibitor 88Ea-like isoform X1 [Harmonia axyridis]|uniref:serine protease inhibitor 88Ea-like isoform X1 n=1 Tax=Harmonia axyridis TaxID=115357 RepID=UPI001E27910F|nr:serine protease inhibitor 88Ea-like isoform X1 [Harmonia axyridis]XP_045471065.1 serine protease inhibitor 88Ea-like isoform X1 [Harmonia axyridis]XP_045471066.1 serine protease inhibitor 88Ea-like isoform X1 [Harmonia axyridis]
MKLLVGTALTLFVLYTFSQETSANCLGPLGTVNQNGQKSLYTGQQDFSLALLNAINKLSPDDNLFFSPYSTYHALLIAFFLAGNQTEKFLRTTLRLDNSQTKNDIYLAYKLDKLRTNFTSLQAAYEFTSANKIFVGDDVPVRDCILDLFQDEITITKFRTDAEAARNRINQWVEDRTNRMIKNLLPPGSVDQLTDLVLVNAAYFKGMWLKKFNPAETRQEIFYVSPTKQIMVDMMHLEGTFNYEVSETLGAHILEMPYKGEDISMYILLPPFSKTNRALENTLSKLTLQEFNNIVEGKNSFSHTVQVSLPKFSLEQTIELVPILETLGIGNLFKADVDLSSLSTKKRVTLDRGIHKARIILNENGAEAAAATALIGWRIMEDIDEKTEFKCNRPFIFIIFNKERKTVLFTGVFRKPT